MALLLGALLPAGPEAAKAPQPSPSRETVTLRGVLSDTAFPAAGPEGRIRLEVLETGDTLAVTPGRPFAVRLPLDTLWNLCFSGAAPIPPPAPAPAVPATSAGGNPSDTLAERPAAAADTGKAPADSLAGRAPGADSAGAPGAAAAPDSTAALETVADGRIEKCFEVLYLGTDSVFSAKLGEGPATVVLEPQAAPAAAAGGPADSAGTAEAGEETYRPEDAVQLKKVIVRAQRAPKRSLGKSTVSAKLIKRMPGLAEADVIRSIQALPGVVASSDFSTKIYVRGGGADQNLILLDNAVVYSPVHFFGLFSTFLVEGIDEVNFYKGGFPPEYGNRLSSVLDIKSRKGGKDTVESLFTGSSVKVSTFASQAHTEGRQGPFRWLVAGRRTYIDQALYVLRRVGATDLDLPYAFYDLQGSGNWDLGNGDGAMASFYQGRDELDFGLFQVDWGNTVIPLNLDLRLDEDWTSKSTAAYSLFSQGFGLRSIFRIYNRIATWSLKQSFEYSGLAGHRLSFGAEASRMETIFGQELQVAKLDQRDAADFWLTSVFAQDRWTRGDAEWTTGLRLTHSTLLDGVSLEPRLSLKYRLPSGSLDLHTGWYAQYVNSIQFQDQENLNEFYYPAQELEYNTVKPATSLLFSAGYSGEKLLDEWDWTLEGYYKTLNHLSVFAPNELPDSLRNRADLPLGEMFKEAQGYSYGAEISLRRPEGILFGGISYSYGTSVIKEDGTDSAYYPKWHQPHSLKADLAINWNGGKESVFGTFQGRRYFRSSTQLKYASGLPFTAEVGYIPSHLIEESPGRDAGGPTPEFQGNINTIKGGRNMAFVPAYLRWDAKVIDMGVEGKWGFSLTLLNLTDHKNIFFYTYDRRENPPKREEITQFPFFPLLLNYEYYF